jgi:hypothetical protein
MPDREEHLLAGDSPGSQAVELVLLLLLNGESIRHQDYEKLHLSCAHSTR